MRFAALLLALLAFAAPAAAQQFPSQQRGLAADTAYQSGDIDSVNLFNGNLSLAIPLGQPYPVGPGFIRRLLSCLEVLRLFDERCARSFDEILRRPDLGPQP